MALNLSLDLFVNMPVRRKLLLVCLFFIISVAAFYKFLFFPASSELKGLRLHLTEITKKVDEGRQIAKNINKFKLEKRAFDIKLKKALVQLPDRREIPGLIDSVSRAAGDAGLEITEFKPLPENKMNFYAEVPVHMKVYGNFMGFYRFCRKIRDLPRIVDIGGLSIMAVQDEAPGRGKYKRDLAISFRVTTFRFIREET